MDGSSVMNGNIRKYNELLISDIIISSSMAAFVLFFLELTTFVSSFPELTTFVLTEESALFVILYNNEI